ncbi:Pyoverdine/dityrosine biosynthesis protein-domain-containing protein [Dactylonectria macrodidyma]|uniref:Pyoverdine/dityrosine biosynthesis protein-domain-containing protein n=1 Tax=Dactylonectria macrodidyma TaxID=307937 RepID=A0A9P9DV42_9HYPO|nr:Pyoverdine/dityrosine biosynthesis protein-domain-containing protein [Dactylonectria macrodidyma]
MLTTQTVTIPSTDVFTESSSQRALAWGLRNNVRSKTPAISLKGHDGHSATELLPLVNHDAGYVDDVVSSIMSILESFSLQQQGNDVFLGSRIFSPVVRRHVAARSRIPMVLPAFPAKSINVVEKVLGTLPDLGEELALDRLNDLCSRIQKIYLPGAMVLIATDGACYNDLTGVTNDNLWEYSVALRQMVADKGFKCIEFVRIMNLLGLYHASTITKETFINLLEPSRRELMDRYVDPNFDATACIKNDPDYKMTYDGYAKFLKKDLAFGAVRNSVTSGKKFKAKVHETAKAMIARGVAFAELIREKLPDHVRLSIHPSTGLTKISMPLIPQPDSFSMTPWHCAVAVDVSGNFKTAHVATLRNTHELVYKDGHAHFFRQRSSLWEFDAKVEFEHLYCGGLVVRNASGREQSKKSLSDSDKEKLASLAVSCGKIIVKGFK